MSCKFGEFAFGRYEDIARLRYRTKNLLGIEEKKKKLEK